MYDINFKNLRKDAMFGLPFLFIGLVFMIISSGLVINPIVKKASMDKSVEAVDINKNCKYDEDGDYLCQPIYTYNVDGTFYKCSPGYSSSGVDTSDKKVYYNSQKPNECITGAETTFNLFSLIFILFSLIFVIVGGIKCLKGVKQIKKVKKLNETGTLVKQLPYRMVPSGMAVNEVRIMCPIVSYTLPNGTTLELRGTPRYDHRYSDSDGMVDLLIDLNNPDNYYIDFEINRLSGNLPGDYSQGHAINTNVMNQSNLQGMAGMIQNVNSDANAGIFGTNQPIINNFDTNQVVKNNQTMQSGNDQNLNNNQQLQNMKNNTVVSDDVSSSSDN